MTPTTNESTMTMTNTAATNDHAIQTEQDEEAFLLEQLLSARHALEIHKAESSARKFTQNRLEKQLADVEQALLDYVTSNGVEQFETGRHTVTIGQSESVDCPDVEAIPEEYVRTKITREPNKLLIREKRPQGANWYAIKISPKITIHAKG